jgi:hypothetical protein
VTEAILALASSQNNIWQLGEGCDLRVRGLGDFLRCCPNRLHQRTRKPNAWAEYASHPFEDRKQTRPRSHFESLNRRARKPRVNRRMRLVDLHASSQRRLSSTAFRSHSESLIQKRQYPPRFQPASFIAVRIIHIPGISIGLNRFTVCPAQAAWVSTLKSWRPPWPY